MKRFNFKNLLVIFILFFASISNSFSAGGGGELLKIDWSFKGITGKFGSVHTKLMLEYGTNIAAGVTPGKGGHNFENVPIYENVRMLKIKKYSDDFENGRKCRKRLKKFFRL